MGIGKRIREARMKKGYTQAELSKILNVTPSAITNYENDVSHPKEEILVKIFDTLEVEPNFLFQDSFTKSDFLCFSNEQEHIKKYRSLEALDKKAVDGLLNTLTERNNNLVKQNIDHNYAIQNNQFYMTQYDYGVSAGTGNFLDEWDIPKTAVQIEDTPIARKADYILRVDGDSMLPEFKNGDRVFVKEQNAVEINEIGIFIIDGKCFLKQYKEDYLHSLNPEYDDISFSENQNIKCVGKVLGKI